MPRLVLILIVLIGFASGCVGAPPASTLHPTPVGIDLAFASTSTNASPFPGPIGVSSVTPTEVARLLGYSPLEVTDGVFQLEPGETAVVRSHGAMRDVLESAYRLDAKGVAVEVQQSAGEFTVFPPEPDGLRPMIVDGWSVAVWSDPYQAYAVARPLAANPSDGAMLVFVTSNAPDLGVLNDFMDDLLGIRSSVTP